MALQKITRAMLNTGIADSSDATAITIDSSENVGIGATSPDGQLHVKGTTNRTIKIDPTFSSGTFSSLAFARNGSDLWRVHQNSSDDYLSFYNDATSAHQFSLASNGKIFANVPVGNFSSYASLGGFILQQSAANLGIGVIDSGANNTFKFINNGTEAKIEHNAAVPIRFEMGNTQHLEIHNSGAIKSGSGGMVLQTKEAYADTPTAITSGGTAVIVSTTITVKANSKLCVWGHSGQIQNTSTSVNANMILQVVDSGNTATDISDHNGNHYWWDQTDNIDRQFITGQAISGALSAGTYTVRFLAGAYGGTVTMNYQNKGAHLIIQEIAAN